MPCKRWLTALLLLCSLLPVGRADTALPDAATGPACHGVQRIAQAERSVWQNGQLLEHGQVGQLDTLRREWRREDVSIRYRITLRPCPADSARFLWVYRIGAPYRIQADGQPMPALQPLAAAQDAVYNGRVPALFELPPGARTVDIALATIPYVGSGLIRVETGPGPALMPAIQLSLDVLTHFNDVSSALIGMAGLMALTAWALRRRDRQVLWFGMACVTWALRGLAYQTFVLPVHPLLMEQLNPMLILVTLCCILASTLYSLERMRPAIGHALWGGSALAATAFGVSLLAGQGGVLVRGVVFAVSFAILIGLIVMLARQRRLGRTHAALLLTGYAALTGGAVHDISMVIGVVTPDHWSFITPGFTVMLLCYTFAVSQYLVRNLNRAENANNELEQRIAAKTAQLEASYALLRDSEREAARTQEREHLLREMHDGLGAQLMTALRGVERGAMAREQVLQALQDSLDDLRLLMDSTDMGRQLQGALAAWRSRWNPRLSALDIALGWQVDDSVEQVQLHPDMVLQVMRILQEATANVVKHSGASRMLLKARADGPVLHLEVLDNGSGLPDTPPRNGARGLRNMQQRARLLGASLEVHTQQAPFSGTRVHLALPLPATPAQALAT